MLAAATGAVVTALGGGLEGGLTAFAVGTLIDSDHLVDYVAAEGFRLDVAAMRSGSYFRKAGRAYVLLHSYEFVMVSFVGSAATGHTLAAIGLLTGAGTHLASDVLYYRFTPFAYSFVYRAAHGFRLDAFKPRRPARGSTQHP